MAAFYFIPSCQRSLLFFLCACVIVINVAYLMFPTVLHKHLFRLGYYSPMRAAQFLANKPGWIMEREQYLRKGNLTKLFLFAYMRGGSSIAGELFNCDPSATMWYEPGDAFFAAYYGLHHENLPQHDMYFKNMTRRKLKPDELEAMRNFYDNTFSCNYELLPPEAMAHYFLSESTAMNDYVQCVKGKRTKHLNINSCKSHIKSTCSEKMVETSLGENCHIAIAAVKTLLSRYPNITDDGELLKLLQDYLHTNSVNHLFTNVQKLSRFIKHGRCIETLRRDNAKCLDVAKKKCQKDKLRVVQVLRMKMEDLEPLIKANPDLYVVHYTRDPRAIAYSRNKVNLLFDKKKRSTVREAEFVCEKMRQDIRERTILEKKYPGVFTHLTYESLALDPEGFARRIYATFNQTYPTQWREFIAKHMNGRGNDSGFGVSVKNATKTAFKWRTKIPKAQQEKIASFCADVIQTLGYQL